MNKNREQKKDAKLDQEIEELLVKSRKILAKAGLDNLALEVRLLAKHFLQYDFIKLSYNLVPDAKTAIANFEEAVLARSNGVPAAYLVGHKEFYNADFIVSPATLIPRPETELLVEFAIKHLPEKAFFLDWCTGCGCLGLSIALERVDLTALLLDLSLDALAIAKQNTKNLALEARIKCICADLARPPFLPLAKKGRVAAIIANPPYIDRADILDVMPSVRKFEPELALFAEDKGLYYLKLLIKSAKAILARGGFLLLEHDEKQVKDLGKIALEHGFADYDFLSDLAGFKRVIVLWNH